MRVHKPGNTSTQARHGRLGVDSAPEDTSLHEGSTSAYTSQTEVLSRYAAFLLEMIGQGSATCQVCWLSCNRQTGGQGSLLCVVGVLPALAPLHGLQKSVNAMQLTRKLKTLHVHTVGSSSGQKRGAWQRCNSHDVLEKAFITVCTNPKHKRSL